MYELVVNIYQINKTFLWLLWKFSDVPVFGRISKSVCKYYESSPMPPVLSAQLSPVGVSGVNDSEEYWKIGTLRAPVDGRSAGG